MLSSTTVIDPAQDCGNAEIKPMTFSSGVLHTIFVSVLISPNSGDDCPSPLVGSCQGAQKDLASCPVLGAIRIEQKVPLVVPVRSTAVSTAITLMVNVNMFHSFFLLSEGQDPRTRAFTRI